MVWRTRSFWLAAGAVAYVAFASLQAAWAGAIPLQSPFAGNAGLALAALIALPLLLAIGWIATAPPARGEDRIESGARSAARAAMGGAAVLLAARTGPVSFGFTAMGNLGAATASMASLVGLSRIGSLGGLVEPPTSARRLEAAALGSLLWTVAVALPAARVLAPGRFGELDPILIDYATAAASLGSLGLGIASALRVRATRRLELGVAERATAAVLLALTALAASVLASALEIAPPERILPIATTAAAGAIAASAVTQEATALARALRLILAVTIFAAPPALLAAYLTHAAPARAGVAVLAACALCAVAGLAAPLLARRLAPDGSRWLDALDAALLAALRPDPDEALESALMALRAAPGGGGASGAAATLYRINPAEVVTVDRAGYVHTERAVLPAGLVELTGSEPERIFRVDAARSVEVRRADVRPMVAWLEEKGIAAMAEIRDETDAVALLAMPNTGRTSPMTLEEARSLRAVADRLGAVLSASAALARSRQREIAARVEMDRLGAETTRVTAVLTRDEGRLIAIAKMLERPARLASYSPAARAAIDQIERLAGAGRPVALLSAPGVDGVAWAALAHLASPKRRGPITVLDGPSRVEHDLARWRDPEASPLRAAHGGSLVILDAHALPADVQSFLGAALNDDVGIIVTLPATVDTLVATGQMSERLADRLGDRAVALPTLADRAEDIRALALEHLGRIGVRLQSRPLGLDSHALAALLEHTWPGNEAELQATLLRASLITEGEVIGVRELDRIGFPIPRETRREAASTAEVPGRKRRSGN
jgi:DNA-binding NtrC family response regulator